MSVKSDLNQVRNCAAEPESKLLKTSFIIRAEE